MTRAERIVFGHASADPVCADRVRFDLTECDISPGAARAVFRAILSTRGRVTAEAVSIELARCGITRLDGKPAIDFLRSIRAKGDYEDFKRAIRQLQDAPAWPAHNLTEVA